MECTMECIHKVLLTPINSACAGLSLIVTHNTPALISMLQQSEYIKYSVQLYVNAC